MQNSRGRVLYLDFRALLFWLECLFYILQRSFCSASASRQCFLSLWPIWPYCQHLFKLLQAFYCLLWRRFPYHRCTSLMWSNWNVFLNWIHSLSSINSCPNLCVSNTVRNKGKYVMAFYEMKNSKFKKIKICISWMTNKNTLLFYESNRKHYPEQNRVSEQSKLM